MRSYSSGLELNMFSGLGSSCKTSQASKRLAYYPQTLNGFIPQGHGISAGR